MFTFQRSHLDDAGLIHQLTDLHVASISPRLSVNRAAHFPLVVWQSARFVFILTVIEPSMATGAINAPPVIHHHTILEGERIDLKRLCFTNQSFSWPGWSLAHGNESQSKILSIPIFACIQVAEICMHIKKPKFMMRFNFRIWVYGNFFLRATSQSTPNSTHQFLNNLI